MSLQQSVLSKNNLFFCLLLFGYIFGVIFYDLIGFTFTDEIFALILTLLAGASVLKTKKYKDLVPLLVVFSIFIFYTVYSIIIGSNVVVAIIKDLLIQIKPFLGFFCTLLIKPVLSFKQKRLIVVVCILMGLIMLVAVLTGNLISFFGHESRLATSAVVTALLLLYCSDFSWGDILAFFFILSISILSTRSKAYGFFGVSVLLTIYVKLGGSLKFSLKTFSVFLLLAVSAVYLSWEKIALYYIDGMVNSKEMWSRPAMMLVGCQLLVDYFPFGTGLASFGTFISGQHYSAIYEEYKIDQLWGLTQDNPMFIADAFYPELAQFGVVGVLLYLYFWVSILKKRNNNMLKESLLIILITLFFLIEGIADATFVHNRGLLTLVVLSMAIVNSKINRTDSAENKKI